MSIHTKTKKPALVTLPLTAFRYLYSPTRGKKLVVEIDLNSLKKVNEPNTIDEMAAEARLEYYSGRTKGFTDAKKLTTYLKA